MRRRNGRGTVASSHYVVSTSSNDSLAAGDGSRSTSLSRRTDARSISDRGYRLPILVSLAGFLLVLVFHYQARSQHPLPGLWVYWVGLVTTLVPGILSRQRIATMFSVGLFAFVQSFSYVLSAPYGIVFSTDPIYRLQNVVLLAENHVWTPGSGNGQTLLYSFYPASFFTETALALTTGLPPSVALMVAMSALRFAVLPIAFFKVMRRFVGGKTSLLAAALLFASPSYIFNLPVLQEFAIVFLVLSLYAVFLAPWSRPPAGLSRPAMTAAVVFLSVVAVSHYFTAYVFGFFLAALAFSSFLGPLRRNVSAGTESAITTTRSLRGFRYAAPAFACVFVVWSTFVSNSIDLGWVRLGEAYFTEALSPGSLERPLGVGAGGVRPGFTYSTLELGLIAGAILLWLITAFLGVLFVFWRGRRGRRDRAPAARVMVTLFVPSLILMFVTVPLVFSQGFFIPLRVFEFASLGLAPLAGFALAHFMRGRSIARKTVVAGAVSILVIGGSLLPLASPRFYLIPPNVQYCEMATHETPDVVAAALWAREHIPRNTRVFGDELAFNAFGGYGQFTQRGGYTLFNATTLNESIGRAIRIRSGDIIVVDASLTNSICFATLRDSPFPQAKVDKFGESPLVARLFQNSAIIIYRWEGPE